MRFKIMKWESENVRPNSIFGVFEDGTDLPPPIPTRCGIWVDCNVGGLAVDESQFTFADEAKKAIATVGFYLFGAGTALTEVLNEQRSPSRPIGISASDPYSRQRRRLDAL